MRRRLSGAGEDTLLFESPFDGLLHRAPDFGQIVPEVGFLAHLDVFPIAPSRVFTPVHDVDEGVQLVDVLLAGHGLPLFGQCASSDAVDSPLLGDCAVGINGFEQHSVRVEGEEHFGLPEDADGGVGGEDVVDGHVSHVATSGRSQAAIECDLEGCGFGMAREEHLGGFVRAHGMAARWALSDAVYFLDALHLEQFGRIDAFVSEAFELVDDGLAVSSVGHAKPAAWWCRGR